jgi:hypothetical protein
MWLVSLAVSNTFRLRLFNLLGASIFSLYGYLSGAYPVFIVNAMIALLDVYHLWYLYGKQGVFSLIEIPAENSIYVRNFLATYQKDIERFYPDFAELSLNHSYAIFTMCNLEPVGICIYEVRDDGIIYFKLDYVSLKYKELKGLAPVYANYRQSLEKRGYREILIHAANARYKKYLHSLGYTEELADGKTLRKSLVQ